MPGGGKSREGQRVFEDQAAYEALERLLDIARRNSGQSRRVADFPLAWHNAERWMGTERPLGEHPKSAATGGRIVETPSDGSM
jgi:hypothetical protein